MGWDDVFGELWFWVAAAILWVRAASGVYGAPRALILEARARPPAARLLRDAVRFRLSRPPLFGMRALAPAAFGVLLVVAVSSALAGQHAVAALLVAAAPPLLAERVLSERVSAEAAAAADDDALRAFADHAEQIWRVKLGAIGVALFATLAYSAVVQDGERVRVGGAQQLNCGDATCTA